MSAWKKIRKLKNPCTIYKKKLLNHLLHHAAPELSPKPQILCRTKVYFIHFTPYYTVYNDKFCPLTQFLFPPCNISPRMSKPVYQARAQLPFVGVEQKTGSGRSLTSLSNAELIPAGDSFTAHHTTHSSQCRQPDKDRVTFIIS